jgi:hypothetical protein
MAVPAAIAVAVTCLVGCRSASATTVSSTPRHATTIVAQQVPDTSGRLAAADGMYCRHFTGPEPQVSAGLTSDQVRTVWAERRQYEQSALITATDSAQKAWRTVEHYTRNEASHALEAGSYNPASLPAEPAAVTAARADIARYNHDVCGVS